MYVSQKGSVLGYLKPTLTEINFDTFARWPFNTDFLVVPQTNKLVGFSFPVGKNQESIASELVETFSSKVINLVRDVNSHGAERYLNSVAERYLEGGVQYLEFIWTNPEGAQYMELQMMGPIWLLDRDNNEYLAIHYNDLAYDLEDLGLTLPDEYLFPIEIID